MDYVVSREQPTRPPTTPPPAGDGGRRRPSRGLILAVIIGLLAAAVMVFALSQRGGDDHTSGVKPDTTPSTGTVKPAADALPFGTVTAGEGGAEDLFGIPIRYPHTVDGAAAAAINLTVGASGPLNVVEAAREPLNQYVYTNHAAGKGFPTTAAEAEEARAKAGLDENGQVRLGDGTVDPYSTYLGGTIVPEYGAYRVLPGATADRVKIDLWGPLLTGTARSNGSGDAEVHWVAFRVAVAWDRGDWRLDDLTIPDELTLGNRTIPEPAERAALNVSFAERAELLPASHGWVMVRNAVEDTSAYPEGVATP